MCVATYHHSITGEDHARSVFREGGIPDYGCLPNPEIPNPQLNNPLNQDMEAAVRSIAGVTEVNPTFMRLVREVAFPTKPLQLSLRLVPGTA